MLIVIQQLLRILSGAVFFWLVIYWWFVPSAMRFDIPLAHPSTVVTILATITMLPWVFFCVWVAERLAALVPASRRPRVGRAVRLLTFLSDLTAVAAFLWLFAPILGFSATTPSQTLWLFGALIINTWFRILRRGFGAIATGNDEAARPLLGPSAEEVMAKDPRPPILYLRSFDDEAQRATVLGRFAYIRNPRGFYVAAGAPASALMSDRERTRMMIGSTRSVVDEQRVFADYFSSLRPYVAVGRPGELFENADLGAAKLFVPDDAWQETVIELIDASAAIVLDVATSQGLVWEIEQVVSRVRPRKILLILPRSKKEYRRFWEFGAKLFPRRLPEEPPESRLLMFQDDWIPYPLDNPTLLVKDAVEPFCKRLDLIIPE
jgi:hypothetical protein